MPMPCQINSGVEFEKTPFLSLERHKICKICVLFNECIYNTFLWTKCRSSSGLHMWMPLNHYIWFVRCNTKAVLQEMLRKPWWIRWCDPDVLRNNLKVYDRRSNNTKCYVRMPIKILLYSDDGKSIEKKINKKIIDENDRNSVMAVSRCNSY